MVRGQRAELDLIEDSGIGIASAIIPPFEITDIVDFKILTIDTDDVIMYWENPKYKKKNDNENN